MDPESPFARVERTLWTVWYYITGAVNRFLRPPPADTVNSDPNSFQESTELRVPPDSSQEEDDSVGGALDEERSLAKASVHASSCSVATSDLCTADVHLRPDEESTEYKKQLSGGSADGEGTREERLHLTGNHDTGPLAAEDDTANEQETAKIITMSTCGEDEKNEGRRVSTEDTSENMEKSEGNTGTEEEEVKVKVDNGQKMLHKDEQCLEEEDADVTELRPEEEESIHRGETRFQMDDPDAVMTEEDAEKCDVVLDENEKQLPVKSEDESVVTGQERPMARIAESKDEGEQETVTEEEKTSDAAHNQEKDMITEQDMRTECVTCRKEGVQNAEQDDVTVTEMQTRDPSLTLEERTEQQRFPSEEQETVCSTTVTVTPETEQEIREFKNISPGTTEGHVVMLQEVNTATYEKTQEGVPEYNNELRPDENPAQKILEVEDCEEIQTVQLPEEEEEESLQQGGSVLVREDNQESIKGDVESNFEEAENQSAGTASQDSVRLSEEEEGRLQKSSMKTELQTREELQGEAEELLVDVGTDEVLYDSEDAAEEVCDMKGGVAVEEDVRDADEKFQKPEKSFLDESGQAMANIRTLTLKGDMAGSGFLKHSGETEHDEKQEERDQVDEMQKTKEQVGDLEVSVHLKIQDNQSSGCTAEMSEQETREEGVQNAEQDNVTVTEMQTKTRDTSLTLEERTEQQRFPSEEQETVCSTTVTVTPETGQEIREFKNISPGTTEGHVVMLQEVNTATYEKTQEGVPEYNNELRPDENPAQKILEVEDCEEIQTVQLPEEEEEEEEEESLQQGGSVLMREDNQESITGDVESNFEEAENQSAGTASQDSGRLSEEEEGRLQESSMKTELQTREELQGEAEELLVDVGTDEVLYDSEDAAEEVCDMKGAVVVEEEVRDADEKFQKMPEKSFLDEDAQTADESNTSQSVIEHVTETEASPRHQDVIDEEILDLWIETAMSEDAGSIKQQEGPELGEVSPKKKAEQLMESNSGESALVSDTDISSSTVESEFLDQSLNEAQLLQPTSSLQGIDDMSADISELPAKKEEQYPDSGVSSPQMTHLNEGSESTEESGSQRDVEVTDMAGEAEWKDTEQADVTKMRSLFQVEEKEVGDETLVSDSSHTEFMSDSAEEEIISNEATSQSEGKLDGPQPGWLGKKSHDLDEVDATLLDFTMQKSRIAVKNPLVRPPKDPRSLLNMPSADPTPSPPVQIRATAGVPLGGLGIGIKLPGFGAGFPVLKKTKVEKDDNQETASQQETGGKPQETSEAPQQDEVQHKPKWMPPRHPGFGNPLMSELKTKLKKTTKE